MSLLGGISKSLSQVIGTVGAIPKAQLGTVGTIVNGVMAQASGVNTMQGLEGVIGKLVNQHSSGLSSHQKEAMSMMVKSKLASASKAAHTAAGKAGQTMTTGTDALSDLGEQQMMRLQMVLQRLERDMAQVTNMMAKLYQANKSILNNIK